jgi:hypothetical protein
MINSLSDYKVNIKIENKGQGDDYCDVHPIMPFNLIGLEQGIKETYNKYDECERHLMKKFCNMCLINKITQKYFSINDNNKTTFENNYVISQLQKIYTDNISEIIKSYTYSPFEEWISISIQEFCSTKRQLGPLAYRLFET